MCSNRFPNSDYRPWAQERVLAYSFSSRGASKLSSTRIDLSEGKNAKSEVLSGILHIMLSMVHDIFLFPDYDYPYTKAKGLNFYIINTHCFFILTLVLGVVFKSHMLLDFFVLSISFGGSKSWERKWECKEDWRVRPEVGKCPRSRDKGTAIPT